MSRHGRAYRPHAPPGAHLLLARTASGKSLLERIEDRGRFPSAGARYCTSDTKRTPIERELRRYLNTHPRYAGRIISAMGMRAAESPARSKLVPRPLRPIRRPGAAHRPHALATRVPLPALTGVPATSRYGP